MAATIADYIRREFKIESSSSGIAVGPMEIKHPIVIPKEVPQSEMPLHIKAVVDLSIGKGKLEFSLVSEIGSTGSVVNAACSIKYADSKDWLNKWMQSSYLIKGRIQSLELGIKNSNTQRFLRDTAYRLFSSTVEYSPNYQGMQEILLDTEELEAVALLQLCRETNVGFFFCNPLWIDSIMQLSGFVMNSLKLDSGAFIADGWESFQLAQELNASRAYRVYVKMQSMQENLFVGNLSLFDDDYVKVGMVKGLKFRIIPRSLMDFLIPRKQPAAENIQFSNTSPNSVSLKQSSKPQQGYDIKKEAHQNQKHNTDIWRDVLNIIAQEVGLPASQIEKESELSTLGIDSLLSLTIVSNLQDRLQIDVPRTLFEDCSTFEGLRVYFNNMTNATSHSDKTYVASEVILTPSTSQGGSDITDKVIAFRSLIARGIGIPADDLHDTEDLSAMGLDSLMAFTIAGAAREQLGITISPDILSSQSSILEIEKVIGLSTQSTSRPLAPSLSVLLQGEPKTAQKTLFLFPDGSGSASSYIKLPVTDLNLVIYGLNSPYLKAGPNSTFGVKDLVRAWVQEMQNRQPKGPYIIGGWSSGGYYTFEAAKLLINAGEQVQKLLLIDVPPRNVYEAMPKEVLQWLVQNNIMGAGAPSPTWLVQHFESTLTAVDKYTPTPLNDGVPEVYIIWASDGVISQSDAEPDLDLRVRVSRFLLQQRDDFGGNGWEKLLPGSKIFVTKAPGSHFSMTMPPNVCFSLIGQIACIILTF
jgi:iterative type I PKS product template protein